MINKLKGNSENGREKDRDEFKEAERINQRDLMN